MSQSNYSKFQVKNITFPRIDATFVATPMESFDYSFRVEGYIPSPRLVQLLFGVRIASRDKIDSQTSKASAIVEAVGEFEFETDLPILSHVSELPLAANLLALMYPFIREKMSTFFHSNGLQIFLPPVNTISLIKENSSNQNFKLIDVRNAPNQQHSIQGKP